MIDTSAIVAAIANEPDADVYRTAIKTAPVRLMSAVSLLETRIVLFSRLGSNAMTTFDELIARAGIVVDPFDESLVPHSMPSANMARDEAIQPSLNIVDCVVYALARSRNLPLLFKGRDFSHTDIRSAVPFAV